MHVYPTPTHLVICLILHVRALLENQRQHMTERQSQVQNGLGPPIPSAHKLKHESAVLHQQVYGSSPWHISGLCAVGLAVALFQVQRVLFDGALCQGACACEEFEHGDEGRLGAVVAYQIAEESEIAYGADHFLPAVLCLCVCVCVCFVTGK